MVKKMKVHFIKILIFSIIVFSVIIQISSCNDPIFFKVHEEIEVREPKIGGSPINFAVLNNKMYTASGKKIYSYSADNWSLWKTIENNVMQIASTSDSLYVLHLDKSSGKLRRYYNDGNSVQDFNFSHNIQTIHTIGDVLFLSVRDANKDNNIYRIYYLNAASLTEITSTTSESILNGAASDTAYYYLCTHSGIFCVDKLSLSSALPNIIYPGTGFTGIINLTNDYAVAISDSGKLYEINSAAGIELPNVDFGDKKNSTGALALWYKYNDDSVPPSLLLAGRKETYESSNTSYSNGYLEIEIDVNTGRIPGSAEFREPGKHSVSSVDNYDRYSSSLSKKPINHIIQTPSVIDDKMTLFVSTQQDGVWSYRNRAEGWQWNAED
jgi:hypothetical protein